MARNVTIDWNNDIYYIQQQAILKCAVDEITQNLNQNLCPSVQSTYGADVSANADDKTKKKKQLKTSVIDDPESFNAIVRICLKQLLPAIYRFLHIKLVTASKLKPETSSN
ncbi:unnamed protein product [Rotaria sp. Silwood2]|nr:unnamed protein product [Rotaria sp. Silwood2]CAF2797510.1 unnamed protein product [Rotaria sp. Silwood2]CAF3339025.1 unnamed protein product [Rotaria sp. Silwood2]CAF4070819.1 unnamed protein product [Rotaria sp. Silwood2]CAF4145942.1 unnamed protein product [Rotaria sp. Silwood2]